MADSDREPPLCPCGFWGSPNTSGLCSKCYKEMMLKNNDCQMGNSVQVIVTPDTPKACSNGQKLETDTTPSSTTETSVASTKTKSEEKISDPSPSSNDATSQAETAQLETNANLISSSQTTAVTCIGTNRTTTITTSIEANLPSLSHGDNVVVEQPGTQTTLRTSVGTSTEQLLVPSVASVSTETEPLETRSVSTETEQKPKRRCQFCKAKLPITSDLTGRCKCNGLFCDKHRLPEQHECSFDHKAVGRQEAKEKMVSPKKHVGTSLKRLDSDS